MKRILRAIAVSLGLLLVTPAIAEAHTIQYETNLVLRVSDRTPPPNTAIKFRARLSSGKAACFRNRVVVLRKNGVVVDRDRTNEFGLAVFHRNSGTQDANYQARFRGLTLKSNHLHLHQCLASVSNIVHVDVQT